MAAATGEPHDEPLKGHSSSVYAVAFSPDGKLVLVSDWITKDTEKPLGRDASKSIRAEGDGAG
jgi:WD40 repeat protein